MNAARSPDSTMWRSSGSARPGLTLAHLLGLRGLRVLALEREPQFYGNARAVYTDDECMRVFQAAGVAADARSRHAARHAGAMGAGRRIGAEPAPAHRPALRLGGQQLLLSAVSRNQDGAIARALPERDGAARPRGRRFLAGRRRGRRRARRECRLAVRPGARGRAEALRKRSRAGAMARRLRRRPQRRALQPRNQDGRQELSRAVARRRHQGEGGRGLLPPHALFQLPLRSEDSRPSPARSRTATTGSSSC